MALNLSFSPWIFLFDMDGTLVRTDALHKSLWRVILEAYGVVWEDQTTYEKRIIGRSDKELFREWSGEIRVSDPEDAGWCAWMVWKRKMFLERMAEVEVVEGAYEWMKGLVDKGYWVGVVTNSDQMMAERLVDHVGCGAWLDVLITADSGCDPKPSPEPYRLALKELGGVAEQCIIFEDSEVGLQSARHVQPYRVIRMGDVAREGVFRDFKGFRVEDILPPSAIFGGT